jgi:hypothetical protein
MLREQADELLADCPGGAEDGNWYSRAHAGRASRSEASLV